MLLNSTGASEAKGRETERERRGKKRTKWGTEARRRRHQTTKTIRKQPNDEHTIELNNDTINRTITWQRRGENTMNRRAGSNKERSQANKIRHKQPQIRKKWQTQIIERREETREDKVGRGYHTAMQADEEQSKRRIKPKDPGPNRRTLRRYAHTQRKPPTCIARRSHRNDRNIRNTRRRRWAWQKNRTTGWRGEGGADHILKPDRSYP